MGSMIFRIGYIYEASEGTKSEVDAFVVGIKNAARRLLKEYPVFSTPGEYVDIPDKETEKVNLYNAFYPSFEPLTGDMFENRVMEICNASMAHEKQFVQDVKKTLEGLQGVHYAKGGCKIRQTQGKFPFTQFRCGYKYLEDTYPQKVKGLSQDSF